MMAINAKFYPIRPSYETSDLAIVLKYPSPFQAQFGFTSLASNARYYYCGAYCCCCFLCCRRLSRVFLIRGVQEVRQGVLEPTMGKMIEKTSLFQEQKSQSIWFELWNFEKCHQCVSAIANEFKLFPNNLWKMSDQMPSAQCYTLQIPNYTMYVVYVITAQPCCL